MENKKFTQNLNQEDLIAYNCHLIDKKNKSSILMPILGVFMAGLGVYSLFQEGNNVVSSIIYIVLGLFTLFFLKKIMSYIQKKSVRKHITNNFSKVDMEVTVLEEGIRFEIIEDEEVSEEKEEVEKTNELSDNELRELERYQDETSNEEVKLEQDEDYVPIDLPLNYGGVYEGYYNNDKYIIDISKKGIYISLYDNKEQVEIITMSEEGIVVKYQNMECTLSKKEINDPNSLLKFISSDESIYVNLGKIAKEGEEPKVEEETTEEPAVNALTIPWNAMVKVEEEPNYIFINMLGYEAMIIKKASCDELESLITHIKEKLQDEKKYEVIENK